MKRWDVIPSGDGKPRGVIIAVKGESGIIWDRVTKMPMWPPARYTREITPETAPEEMRAEVMHDAEAWFRDHCACGFAPGWFWLAPEECLFQMMERFLAEVLADPDGRWLVDPPAKEIPQ